MDGRHHFYKTPPARSRTAARSLCGYHFTPCSAPRAPTGSTRRASSPACEAFKSLRGAIDNGSWATALGRYQVQSQAMGKRLCRKRPHGLGEQRHLGQRLVLDEVVRQRVCARYRRRRQSSGYRSRPRLPVQINSAAYPGNGDARRSTKPARWRLSCSTDPVWKHLKFTTRPISAPSTRRLLDGVDDRFFTARPSQVQSRPWTCSQTASQASRTTAATSCKSNGRRRRGISAAPGNGDARRWAAISLKVAEAHRASVPRDASWRGYTGSPAA